jgi:Arc/MetJ-type ribon-helix-helix transcriptional regulator
VKVELSERTRERVERLVVAGEYPSVEAAIDAAVELLDLEVDFTDEQLAEFVTPAYEDIQAGRVRPAEEVIARARAMIESKSGRRPKA